MYTPMFQSQVNQGPEFYSCLFAILSLFVYLSGIKASFSRIGLMGLVVWCGYTNLQSKLFSNQPPTISIWNRYPLWHVQIKWSNKDIIYIGMWSGAKSVPQWINNLPRIRAHQGRWVILGDGRLCQKQPKSPHQLQQINRIYCPAIQFDRSSMLDCITHQEQLNSIHKIKLSVANSAEALVRRCTLGIDLEASYLYIGPLSSKQQHNSHFLPNHIQVDVGHAHSHQLHIRQTGLLHLTDKTRALEPGQHIELMQASI